MPLAAATTPLQIRPDEPSDWPGVWTLLEPAFRAGEISPQALAITEAAARRLGVRLMPFSLVVSSSIAGFRGWQRTRSQVVATLPGAFRHRRLADIDALVRVRSQVAEAD